MDRAPKIPENAMSTPSIPSSHHGGHVPGENNGEHGSNDPATQSSSSTTPTPTGEGNAQLSRLGKLKAKLSGVARRTGEGVASIESPLGSTASGGYLGWGANNTVSSGGGVASASGHVSEGTKTVAEVTGALGAVPQALDIVSTAVGTAHKAFTLSKHAQAVSTTEKGTLEGDEARRVLPQSKGNLGRAVPGAIRDVGLGSLNMASRMQSVAHPGTSLYGKPPHPVNADGGLAIASGAMYVAAGALQSRKVDRGVQRTHAFGAALNHPASAREDTTSETMQALDDLHSRRDIDPNVYSILRQRSEGDVRKFVENFDALGPDGQRALNKTLHFAGEQNKLNVLNFTRKTNLNTASTRRAIREDVIDAFIKSDLKQGGANAALEQGGTSAAAMEGGTGTVSEHGGAGAVADPARISAVLDEMKTVRKESRGRRVGPDLSTLPDELKTGELDKNALSAIARSGNPEAFLARYQNLSAADKTRVRDTLHFDSWRFWRSDATLPTTRYQRSDIRVALVKHFSDGATIERLQTLKRRYNAKVVPLKASGIPAQTAEPPEMLKHHVTAYQGLNLDNLKEEKRHAKVQIAYGGVNMAMGVAELAVNPVAAATAGQLSASRAVLSPVYLIYAGRRGIVSYITQKNARPIDSKMHEEALMRAMPRLRERIETGGAPTKDLKNRDMFLRGELKLSEADIRKLNALELSGNHAGAREFLAAKHPENNVLIALRKLADERGGVSSEFHRNEARKLIDDEAQTYDSDELRAIADGSNPDESFAALKTHFLEHAAYRPDTAIRTLSEQLSAGTVKGEVGFDKAPYQGRNPDDIATEFRTRFAQDNPPFAIRQFVASWRAGGEGGVQARNMLRDCRFTEKDIATLNDMPEKDACKWLEGHLFGENVRRRFSTVALDQPGRNRAANAARHVQLEPSDAAEPLQWRSHFEEAGVDVIDNPGTPGLDSMLYALHQNFSGKSDASSSTMHKQVMQAREAVIGELRRKRTEAEAENQSQAEGEGEASHARPLLPVDVARDAETIVNVAAGVFGKPGATVALVDTAAGQGLRRIGGTGGAHAPIGAVVCYDSQSKRTFTLHGGKPDLGNALGRGPSRSGSVASSGAGNVLPSNNASASTSNNTAAPANVIAPAVSTAEASTPDNTTTSTSTTTTPSSSPRASTESNGPPQLPPIEPVGGFLGEVLGRMNE
jgi:hypothetical protein